MTVGLNIEFENDPEKIGIPILEMLAKLRNEGAVKKQAEILDWSLDGQCPGFCRLTNPFLICAMYLQLIQV